MKDFRLTRRAFGFGLAGAGTFAILGRATRAEAPPTVFAADSLQLPQGAAVVSAIAASGMVTVTYTIGPATQVRIFDNTGALQRQFDIVIK